MPDADVYGKRFRACSTDTATTTSTILPSTVKPTTINTNTIFSNCSSLMGATGGTGFEVSSSGDNNSLKIAQNTKSSSSSLALALVPSPIITSTITPSYTTSNIYYSTNNNNISTLTKKNIGTSCFAKANTKEIYALTENSKMQNKSATAEKNEASKCFNYYQKEKSTTALCKGEEVSQKLPLSMSHFNRHKMNLCSHRKKSSVPVYVMLPLDTVYKSIN